MDFFASEKKLSSDICQSISLCSKCASRLCVYLQDTGEAVASLLVDVAYWAVHRFFIFTEGNQQNTKACLEFCNTHAQLQWNAPGTRLQALSRSELQIYLSSWKDVAWKLQHKNRLTIIWPLQKTQFSPQGRIPWFNIHLPRMLANLKNVKIH